MLSALHDASVSAAGASSGLPSSAR